MFEMFNGVININITNSKNNVAVTTDNDLVAFILIQVIIKVKIP